MRPGVLLVLGVVLGLVPSAAGAQDGATAAEATAAPLEPSAWVAWSVSRYLADHEARRRGESTTWAQPYPSGSDDEIEVAAAWCFVTHGARGQVDGFARLDCYGASSYGSTWRVELRGALGDRGIANVFGRVEHAVWRECIEAMVTAPRARVRRGEAFERYCLPRVQRALRAAR